MGKSSHFNRQPGPEGVKMDEKAPDHRFHHNIPVLQSSVQGCGPASQAWESILESTSSEFSTTVPF